MLVLLKKIDTMAFRKHAINTISMYEPEYRTMWILYRCAAQLNGEAYRETFTSKFTFTMHFCTRTLEKWCKWKLLSMCAFIPVGATQKETYDVYLAQPTLCDKIVLCEFFMFFFFICFLFLSAFFFHFQMWQQLTGTMCKYIVNTRANGRQQASTHLFVTVPVPVIVVDI